MEQETFKYFAFISYSHQDQKIARKLQKRLQNYHLPSALQQSHPDLPKNLKPIFIDEAYLLPDETLKNAIQKNLEQSNYLLLICSPNSAKSPYVNDEVKFFIESGRLNRIIPIIVGGVPHSGGATECFPQAILDLPRDDELLGIDVQKFGENDSFLRVIAAMLKLDITYFISWEKRQQRKKASVYTSVLVALLTLAVILVPPPYSKVFAENVMDNILGAYVRAGHQYENLYALTECAVNHPENFSQALQLYKNQISFEGMTNKNSVNYLREMIKTGKVMPWSRKPMRQNECEELLTLADSRENEYSTFASVLEFVMTDDFARRYYASQYTGLLHDLLKTDADISSALYQIVCAPHVTGKYSDGSATAKRFESLLETVPKQNEHLKADEADKAREKLTALKGARKKFSADLNSCGVFERYSKKNFH